MNTVSFENGCAGKPAIAALVPLNLLFAGCSPQRVFASHPYQLTHPVLSRIDVLQQASQCAAGNLGSTNPGFTPRTGRGTKSRIQRHRRCFLFCRYSIVAYYKGLLGSLIEPSHQVPLMIILIEFYPRGHFEVSIGNQGFCRNSHKDWPHVEQTLLRF